MKKHSIQVAVLNLVLTLLTGMTNCGNAQTDSSVALVNGLLIDGIGTKPIEHSIVIIRDGKIADVGIVGQLSIPSNTKIVELNGASVLPGFINAHVHDAFSPDNLATWASNGVTSVRDMAIHIKSIDEIIKTLSLRSDELNKSNYARLFSAGPIITVPGGYGGYVEITSPENAVNTVKKLIQGGVDAIKISLEDGFAGEHDLPKLTPEEISAIVQTAHSFGKRVTLHVTQAKYLEQGIDLGVDEIAHVPYDTIPLPVILNMVEKNIFLVPTFTVFRNYGAPIKTCIENLHNFVKAGGHVLLGNDFDGGIGTFETGIPMYEIECMQQAGMTPMDIIVSATKNGAYACGQAGNIGTIEVGKSADILIVNGNPLNDIHALSKIQLVIKNGVVIADHNHECLIRGK
jgi:imidazolonepropionase-like amidohydrolase